MQVDTQGPGWGGAFDCENACHLVRLSSTRQGNPLQRKHARRMLDGFLLSPEFHVPETTTWKRAGDMSGAVIGTGWWPDRIWTAHQAYMIYHLSEIHLRAGWQDCLDEAVRISEWFLRNQAEDGSIPALWGFEAPLRPLIRDVWRPAGGRTRPPYPAPGRAFLEYECQPASCAHMVTALLKLAQARPEPDLRPNARRLMDFLCRQLESPCARFGNGELDYLCSGAWSMDPTGLAYIIWALADAFQAWGEDRSRSLLERYTMTLLAYGVTYDCREGWLRPPEKTSLPPYGADIRMAGGITHGNWRPCFGEGSTCYFNYLMNRNEIAQALARSYRALGDERIKDWLVAFMNWGMYFQFTQEVAGSPVSTLGGQPQNHPWTSDSGNWNNDWGATTMKMAGTCASLLEDGLLEETE
jgi:hypothetical protein